MYVQHGAPLVSRSDPARQPAEEQPHARSGSRNEKVFFPIGQQWEGAGHLCRAAHLVKAPRHGTCHGVCRHQIINAPIVYCPARTGPYRSDHIGPARSRSANFIFCTVAYRTRAIQQVPSTPSELQTPLLMQRGDMFMDERVASMRWQLADCAATALLRAQRLQIRRHRLHVSQLQPACHTVHHGHVAHVVLKGA